MPVEVLELQEGQILTTLRLRVGPLKKTLTRGISILWERSGSWESSGRGLGALRAGFVALGEVWELWELDLSCLARFGRVRL